MASGIARYNIDPITISGVPIPGGQLQIKPSHHLSESEFQDFCASNQDLRIEQDKNGTIYIMAPVDHDGGITEGIVYGYLFMWWQNQGRPGSVYSPSTGFKLPDGSTRSADGAWASQDKIAALSPVQRKKFAPLVSDFVIEVRSSSDRLAQLKRKMTDTWIKNGVRLAWLIDPISQNAFVYRTDGSVLEVTGFSTKLSGEKVCPGFELDLSILLPR